MNGRTPADAMIKSVEKSRFATSGVSRPDPDWSLCCALLRAFDIHMLAPAWAERGVFVALNGIC